MMAWWIAVWLIIAAGMIGYLFGRADSSHVDHQQLAAYARDRDRWKRMAQEAMKLNLRSRGLMPSKLKSQRHVVH